MANQVASISVKRVRWKSGQLSQCLSVAPQHRAAPRGATFDTGRGANLLYAITTCQEQENSQDVVTGIVKVFNFDVYSLLDLGASLYFVTPCVANHIEILLEKLCKPLCVSTPIGESILVERVYHDCLISYLVELDMVDFGVILGMD